LSKFFLFTYEYNQRNGHQLDELLRRWVDVVPILGWMSGPNKQCIYFNRQWQEFTGRPLEQLLGDRWAEDVHPKIASAV